MSSVQLYVYDLSRGMAKNMSMMLTGRQIDGIWHTSVVAYGREVFFGQGILEARPGTTHHGQPVQIIDCGRTEVDEATFQEYIASLAEMYTPHAYHLIEFNCNHFTADVVGFLTGGEIPAWISGLPAEFLATPFGQAMKPQIDAMFRRTAPSEHPVTSPSSTHRTAFLPTPPTSGSSSPSPFASSLLNTITTSATAGPPATPAQTPPRPSPETSPLILISSSSYFARILKQHPAVVVNFTNTPSCPPCRVIKPVYEAIASGYASTFGVKGARFVEVELSVGEGRDIASRYGVSATPTFMFFRDGKKVDELRGAAKRELEAKVEEFLESVWPSHPHRKVYLSQVESLPTTPLTSTTVPKYPALLEKLESFGTNETAITLFKDQVVPFLEGKTTLSDADLETMAMVWSITSAELLATLEPEQTFPIIDLWRVGLLKPRLAAFVALKLSTGAPDNATESVSPIVALATMIVKRQGTSTPKPFLITTLRLLTNLLAPLPVANLVLASCSDERLSTLQENVVSLVVDSLLHSDAGVRSAAAGVSVNMAVWRHRVANKVKRAAEDGDEAEWEVELVSALVEGIGRETDEDVAHRLLVALALILHLSPGYVASLQPLLAVLGAKSVIGGKVRGWKKKEVKKLAEEITAKLC